jgi:hypothetical protein
MRSRALVIVCMFTLTLFLMSSTSHGSTVKPPTCSSADTRRNATLLAPSPTAAIYLRFCGPARAVLRIGTSRYVIKGGHCVRGTNLPTAGPRLGGIAIGLISDAPKPGRGILLWWDPPFTNVGRLQIDDSEIEIAEMRVAASGTVIVGEDLNSGRFLLYGRDASGPTGPLVRGSWSCR